VLNHHRHHWQISPFLAIALEDSARLHPVFTSSDFATLIYLQSKVVSFASNPQPGGPSPCIYVPQWQGDPVVPPGTGLPFRRLLRLAGLRRGYSNPPPPGEVALNSIRYISVDSLYCIITLISRTIRQNTLAQVIMLLECVWEVLGSNLGRLLLAKKNKLKKLCGFGPLANYADRATAASWRSSANFCG
jgi:hypothetical protein